MGFYAFLGEDAEKQRVIFHDAYRRAAYRLSTPTREHFKNVRFSVGPGEEGLWVTFSDEALPRGDYATGSASLRHLKHYLKPKYRHAFDPATDTAARP